MARRRKFLRVLRPRNVLLCSREWRFKKGAFDSASLEKTGKFNVDHCYITYSDFGDDFRIRCWMEKCKDCLSPFRHSKLAEFVRKDGSCGRRLQEEKRYNLSWSLCLTPSFYLGVVVYSEAAFSCVGDVFQARDCYCRQSNCAKDTV